MIFIFVLLFKGVYGFLFLGAQPPVAPLFPGVKTPGLPVLSFFHWIIAIFILAGVHEFNHGLISRLYNIRVKSSGFAVFSGICFVFLALDLNFLAFYTHFILVDC